MDSTNRQQIIDSVNHGTPFEYPSLPSEVFTDDSARQVGEITETFLDLPKTEMITDLLYSANLEWMSYLVLGMLALIAFLWYFVPDRLSSVFYLPEVGKKARAKDSAQYSPGLVINGILSLNLLLSFSMLSYFVLLDYFPYLLKGFTTLQIFAGIAAILCMLYLFKFFTISFSGFVFNIVYVAKYQNRIFANANNLLGILLLPLLFFLVNWNEPKLLIVGIILVISAQILKWYSTFFIIISVRGILLFHFIVYLCTLEIIPLVVLIRLLNSSLA